LEENVKIAIFHGRALALDETAEVKEEDVRNKSTTCLIEESVFYGKHKV
jgi:hypothetical protein